MPKLTHLRQQAAQDLESRLVSELKPLAIGPGCSSKLTSVLSPPATHGADAIQFLFSPNPGEPLQPLAETASGGEMSRFLLALKACFSQVDLPIGTMVFDEIDVGVSGRVAQAIAEKLFQLGSSASGCCASPHQPMVAAMADAHFHVGKHVVDSPTAQAASTAKTAKTEERRQKGSGGKRPPIYPTARTGSQRGGGESGSNPKLSSGLCPSPNPRATGGTGPSWREGESHQESLSFAEALLSPGQQPFAKKFVTS